VVCELFRFGETCTSRGETAAMSTRTRRHRLTGGTALFVVTAATLVVLFPTLRDVYAESTVVFDIAPGWLVAVLAAAAANLVATWALQRIVLRTERWVDIANAQLAGNAASHLLPAGSAAGAGVQLRMLTVAGFPLSTAMTSLGATSLIATVASLIVLPAIVLVATAAGSDVETHLIVAMLAGAAILAGVLGALVILVSRDPFWHRLARIVASVRQRVRRPVDEKELESRLLAERDLVRGALRDRSGTVVLTVVGRALADFTGFYLALRAVGSTVNPAAALAAFVVAEAAGMIPLTPGGVGFVEAGFTGVLVVAGASSEHARAAVAIYRLAGTWVPCCIGGLAYLWFRGRHRRANREGWA
jgi:uncharacterized protein (TIRG00374 family)